MDVGMVSQIAGPGMQHAHQTNLPSNEAWVARQLLGGFRRRPKQSGVKELLVSAGKDAQLGWDGEGQ